MAIATRLRRAWINQPSTSQLHYALHGALVLAEVSDDPVVDILFTSGPTVSLRIDRLALGDGWPEHLRLPDTCQRRLVEAEALLRRLDEGEQRFGPGDLMGDVGRFLRPAAL